MKKKRVAFLLGAGVSIPAGMPSTEQLTRSVLQSFDDYHLHPDGHFYRGGNSFSGFPQRHALSMAKDLIKHASAHCEEYFQAEKESGRIVNYEDLYFFLSQLTEHLEQEYENPIIEYFVHSYSKIARITSRMSLREASSLACRYIRDVVGRDLSQRGEIGNHISCILDACRDERLARCDIFTTNHDLLIERSLNEAGIRPTDGFTLPDGEICDWDPSTLDNPKGHILLKLHGSVNWIRFPNRGSVISKYVGCDLYHARDSSGLIQELPHPEDWVLMGTFNKIRDYFRDPYYTLMSAFRRQLLNTEVLIVSGFSFGDKGINTVVCEWMNRSDDRRLLVLHKDGDGYIQRTRGAIRSLWQKYSPQRFEVMPRYLADQQWQDLRLEI